MPYMKNVDSACRGRFLSNRIVDPISPVPFSVEQNTHFLLKVFGFIRYRAAVGQVFQSSKSGDDAIKPFFGLSEAPPLPDVFCDSVKVGKSPR
jgi:hypothetical protein